MSTQPETIQLDPKTAQALADYAAGLGMTIPEFLRKHFAGANGASRVDDVDQWLDEISEGSEGIPTLPRDFFTRDIYVDHD